MKSQELSDTIWAHLANERRRVVSKWRLAMLIRRISSSVRFPAEAEREAQVILRSWKKRQVLSAVNGLTDVYIVDDPFAKAAFGVSDAACLQEAAPCSVLSHLSAMQIHDLTVEIKGALYATTSGREKTLRRPIGSQPEDWARVAIPSGSRPVRSGNSQVRWTHIKPEWDFGWMVYDQESIPVYVLDLERTLIETLRYPKKCGGMHRVAFGWIKATPAISVDKMMNYVDKFDSAVLRQRCGFMLEAVGVRNDQLERWRDSMVRGGSCKLDSTEGYSPKHSERWNLSLNVPESVLAELEGR